MGQCQLSGVHTGLRTTDASTAAAPQLPPGTASRPHGAPCVGVTEGFDVPAIRRDGEVNDLRQGVHAHYCSPRGGIGGARNDKPVSGPPPQSDSSVSARLSGVWPIGVCNKETRKEGREHATPGPQFRLD